MAFFCAFQSAAATMRPKTMLRVAKSLYPPDKQEEATETVLKQAELLSDAWAGA